MGFIKFGAPLALSIALFSAQASAANADPDSFAPGTDISDSFFGVSLSTAGGGSIYSAGPCTNASTGSNAFGPSTYCNSWYGLDDGVPLPDPYANNHDSENYVFRADFPYSARFVSIDIIPDDSNDPHAAGIYDAAGNLLDSVIIPSPNSSGVTTTITFDRPSADIAFLIAGGIAGQTSDIDNLIFESGEVPAIPVAGPLGLLLMSFGLVLLGAFRLHRKT